MNTKFIGVDNFGEFKSVNYKKSDNRITGLRKLIRFVGRIPKEVSRDFKVIRKKISNITWETITLKKFFRGIRNFHISTSYFESMRTPKGIAYMAAPVLAAVMLIFTVCFWTCSDKPLTVSLDGEYIATIESEEVLTQATVKIQSALASTDVNEATSPVIQVSYPVLAKVETSTATDVYEKLVDKTEAVTSGAGGLYVDGVFYGAAEDSAALSEALTQILSDAKAKYDATTTTTFNNDVKVQTGVYSASTIMPVEDIIEAAKHNFSIRLETDFMVEYEKPYDTIYQYDDTQTDDYAKVITEGKNGSQKVYYRLVYIDGVQTDALVQSTEVTEEPVDQVMVVGTQESYSATGSFMWPVPYTQHITSPFEHRWGTFHYGLDISWNGIYGADIVASDSGTVTWAGWDNSGYGYYVIIDHGNGFTTMYAHCCELYVSTGDQVLKGDVIAGVGSTGYSTGDHLHFEICKDGVKVDPELYV